jgi:hypothetical protein
MVTVSAVEKAMLKRWSPYSNTNFRTQFMGEDRHKGERPDPGAPAPIAYLVEQGPHTQLRAHFHEVDQFQIFVNGAGHIGAREASPGLGHFVGPYSAYGPIVAGDPGLAYMTLRNAFDPGAQWLPEHLDEVRPHRDSRREVVFQAAPPVNDEALGALDETRMVPLVERQPDGLAAWSCLVPAGQQTAGPEPAAGGGQYWLVLAGQLLDDTEGPLNRLSMAFVRPEDGPYVARAGSGGLHVLVLQFPRFRPA